MSLDACVPSTLASSILEPSFVNRNTSIIDGFGSPTATT